MSTYSHLLKKELVTISRHQYGFSSNYVLSDKEYKRLHGILFSNDDKGYAAFLIVMLKELDGNMGKVLRILNTGKTTTLAKSRTIIPTALYNFLVVSIKESIILTHYEQYRESDGFISVYHMANLERLKLAYIDRQTIIRTFKKYDITYTKRK
jgi:hypothetical protein